MDIEFRSSPRSTLGVEVELAVVDAEKGGLVCAATEVLAELGEKHTGGVHPRAKNELYESMLEVVTGVCETVAEARADLEGTIAVVQAHLEPRHLALICPGVHPFSEWYELTQTRSDRYDELIEAIQWPARRLMSHGVHFHVGVRSGEHAVAVTNALVHYLPLFVGLSASSPYWHGHDTGLASVRTKIFEAMPTTGIPPRLEDWADFERFMETLVNAGSIKSVREVWWDIRPHPDFGTVELRMCDGIPTLREVTSLAAAAQSLVTVLAERYDNGEELPAPRDWIARENKWRAARYGIEAQLVVDESGRLEPLRTRVEQMVEELAPTAERLGCADELHRVLDILEHGPSCVRQRRVVAEGGSLRDVVQSLRREFETDQPGA
jgi:carboxylate-amine ligase